MFKLFGDILRNNNSTRFSITKTVGLAGSLYLFATFTVAIMIMWKRNEVDHLLIGEIMGFVLTLIGYKNSFGFKSAAGKVGFNEQLAEESTDEPKPAKEEDYAKF